MISLVLNCIDRLNVYSTAAHFAEFAGEAAAASWKEIVNLLYELLGEAAAAGGRCGAELWGRGAPNRGAVGCCEGGVGRCGSLWGSYGVPVGSLRFIGVPVGSLWGLYGVSMMFMGVCGFLWVTMGFLWSLWVSMGCCGSLWGPYGAMRSVLGLYGVCMGSL